MSQRQRRSELTDEGQNEMTNDEGQNEMTNDEGQMTKECEISKSELRSRIIKGDHRLGILSFEVLSSFVIRHSSFLLALLVPFGADAAPKTKLENIACYPSSIMLATAKSRQGVVIQATYS